MDTSQAGRGLFVDTTAFADGMHTIAWIVTDSAGQAEGIGSRFFRVANGGPGSLRAAERAAARPVSNVASEDVDAAPLAMSAVRVRQGFDAGTPFETLQASSDGFAVETEELERVEMKLALSRGTATADTCVRSASCVRCRRGRHWMRQPAPSRGSRRRASSATTTSCSSRRGRAASCRARNCA